MTEANRALLAEAAREAVLRAFRLGALSEDEATAELLRIDLALKQDELDPPAESV